MTILKPNDLLATNLKVLCYGASGLGKTYFASGADNALAIDFERGMISAKRNDIDIITADSAADFKDAVNYARENPYQAVIVDSLTKYGEVLFSALKDAFPDAAQSMQLWQTFDTVSRQRVLDLLSLDKHIVVTALVEDVVTDTGFAQRYPMYKAKRFKQMLTSFFDLVLYFDVEDGKRCIRLTPGSSYVAKNRLSHRIALPDVVYEDDPLFDVQAIINLTK
jgi:phage nucleotide-binding protein